MLGLEKIVRRFRSGTQLPEFGEFVLYADIVEKSVDAIIAFNSDFHICYANRAGCTLFQYEPDELVGRPLSCLIPPDRREAHAAMAHGFSTSPEQARIMGSRGAVAGLRRDGSTVPLDVSILKHGEDARWRYSAVARDISGHVAAERALSKALDEVARSSRARAGFFASISHELRTPLNAVIGFADLLQKDAEDTLAPALRRDYAGYIADSGRHLLFLLNDIIATAAMDSGRTPLAEEEIALDELCGDAAADLARRGLAEIAVDATSRARISGDRDMLKRALLRVLECLANAGTVEGMSIGVRAGAKGPTIVVAHPREFDPARFPRIGMSAGRSISGSSDLGLHLAERIFDLHGGRLEIDSRPAGGMRIVLSLPRNRVLATSSITAA